MSTDSLWEEIKSLYAQTVRNQSKLEYAAKVDKGNNNNNQLLITKRIDFEESIAQGSIFFVDGESFTRSVLSLVIQEKPKPKAAKANSKHYSNGNLTEYAGDYYDIYQQFSKFIDILSSYHFHLVFFFSGKQSIFPVTIQQQLQDKAYNLERQAWSRIYQEHEDSTPKEDKGSKISELMSLDHGKESISNETHARSSFSNHVKQEKEFPLPPFTKDMLVRLLQERNVSIVNCPYEAIQDVTKACNSINNSERRAYVLSNDR
jgi:hypothetical protein